MYSCICLLLIYLMPASGYQIHQVMRLLSGRHCMNKMAVLLLLILQRLAGRRNTYGRLARRPTRLIIWSWGYSLSRHSRKYDCVDPLISARSHFSQIWQAGQLVVNSSQHVLRWHCSCTLPRTARVDYWRLQIHPSPFADQAEGSWRVACIPRGEERKG